MAESNQTEFAPPDWHTITPRIVADNAEALVAFIKQVFEATGEYETARPTVLTIGDSKIMISESGPRDAMPAFLYVYVEDCDLIYQRAIDAGAKSIEAPTVTPYGDRRCMLEDPWKNVWQVATVGEGL